MKKLKLTVVLVSSGGHVDLKLGCAVSEFVQKTKCRVEDVTY